MSAFVPVNTPVTVGMLLAKTPAQNVFWQWVNPVSYTHLTLPTILLV